MKKWLKIAGISLGSLIGLIIIAAIAVPFLFRDELTEVAKKEINKRLEAKVDFKEVSLSLFRSFPNLSLRLVDFTITGKNEFEGVRLIDADGLDFTIDIWSVINGGNPYDIKSVHLVEPDVNIIVLRDGKANYDIYKADTTATTDSSPYQLSLKTYTIKGGNLVYNDKSNGTYVDIKDLNHEGSGDLSSDEFDLTTATKIEALTVSYGGISYLNETNTKIDLILHANLDQNKYTFSDNEINLNSLLLTTTGFIQLKEEGYLMDLQFKAPSNDFKSFLSLIPGAYTKDYSDVKAGGTLAFSGSAKGTYSSSKNLFPAVDLNLKIGNGDFKYPNLPLGVSNIAANMHLVIPGSNFDLMTLDVPELKLKIGNNPFVAAFKLRTPVSDPDIDGKMKGTINLADLAKAFPFDGIDKLSGVIIADIVAKAKMSFLESKNYDKVNISGFLNVSGVNVQAAGYPSIAINDLKMNFTPSVVNITNFNGKFGRSDVKGSGSVNNFLAWFTPDKTMTGNLMLRSGYFDLNEWMDEPETVQTKLPEGADGGYTSVESKPFNRFDFDLDAQANRVVYYDYQITNTALKGHITPERLSLNSFSTLIGKSDLKGDAIITNWFNYVFGNETLGGKINLNSNLLDLNEFMEDETSTGSSSATASEPIEIPSNWNLDIAAKSNKVLYSTHQLDNVDARVLIRNSEAQLTNSTANMLGGKVGLIGAYNTQNPEKPTFNMKINIRDFDFQRTYTAMNTFKKIAPVAQFLTGKFNTDLGMEGELGKDLMPVFSTLNAVGLIETFNAIINNFKPLEEVANKLNIKDLKSFNISNTKNLFEIKNGAIVVQEFPYQLKDIGLRIGGTHQIVDQIMDFNIKTKVPRKLLEQNAAGAMASSGYNALLGEASKYGINIKNSEFVNILFNLKGSLTKPQVTMKLLSGDGQSLEQSAGQTAQAVLDKAKDSVRIRAQEELDKGKETVKKAADKAVDSLTKVAEKKIEEVKDKAVEEVKTQAGKVVEKELGDKIGGKVEEKIDETIKKTGTNEQVKKEADKLKEKLDAYDPFKKKKSGGGGLD